jgi:hypothetical protein
MKITEKDVGRRVIVNIPDKPPFIENEKGEIISIESGYSENIGIKFDKKDTRFHTCSGKTKMGFGYYVDDYNITFEKESKKMTGIRIETEKIVESNGNLSRKITEFKALPEDKLPLKYLDGKLPVVYQENNRLKFENAPDNLDGHYSRYEIVEEKEFQDILKHCRLAGKHLKNVNKEIAQKKLEWNGTETFVI